MAAEAAIHAIFWKQESGRFFEKKLRKKLLQILHGMFERPAVTKKFLRSFFQKLCPRA